jgi:hypothetical protein
MEPNLTFSKFSKRTNCVNQNNYKNGKSYNISCFCLFVHMIFHLRGPDAGPIPLPLFVHIDQFVYFWALTLRYWHANFNIISEGISTEQLSEEDTGKDDWCPKHNWFLSTNLLAAQQCAKVMKLRKHWI